MYFRWKMIAQINIQKIKVKLYANKLQIDKLLQHKSQKKLIIKKDQKQQFDKKIIIFNQFKQKHRKYQQNLERQKEVTHIKKQQMMIYKKYLSKQKIFLKTTSHQIFQN